ncbi:hypothetical protein N2605_26750 [Bradyrhizobium yuanmingense]|uniref:hypothetical protein n=1 Tax=Bradyrhizobium yuanmingense TaxID=108015 RepID=UPI0021A5FB03|nr:hypothetical protein [Bradyrhizobium sp. CB1024]UWU88675.1 hypothetical protein N2605_26750 [Bradyrhizobium sp. CB1024]
MIVPPPLKGVILKLHDTTEFSYQCEKSEVIGITKSINSGRDKGAASDRTRFAAT